MTRLEQLGIDPLEKISKWLGPKDYNNLREATPGLKWLLPEETLIKKLIRWEILTKTRIMKTNIMIRDIWQSMDVRPLDDLDFTRLRLNFNQQYLPSLLNTLKGKLTAYEDFEKEVEDIHLPGKPSLKEDEIHLGTRDHPDDVYKMREDVGMAFNMMWCNATEEVLMAQLTHIVLDDEDDDYRFFIYQLAPYPRRIRNTQKREAEIRRRFALAKKINNGVCVRVHQDLLVKFLSHCGNMCAGTVFSFEDPQDEHVRQVLGWHETDFGLTLINLRRLGEEILADEQVYQRSYRWPHDLPMKWRWGSMRSLAECKELGTQTWLECEASKHEMDVDFSPDDDMTSGSDDEM